MIGNNTNGDVAENETAEPQTAGLVNNFGGSIVGENSLNHDQIIERNFADRIRKEVDSAVTAVENRVQGAILSAMDNVVIQRVEVAVRFITGSSGRRPNSVFQNPYHRDISGNVENTLLMAASSRADVNIDQDKNDETRNDQSFEDGYFTPLRPNNDRQSHTHHNNIHFHLCVIYSSTSIEKLNHCKS